MNTNYIDRSGDEEIIDIVRSVMDNGTGKAETANEHILIRLMQIRGTPMTSFEFDQERVDFHYNQWSRGCKCTECKTVTHDCDCAVHNEPATPKGDCDCKGKAMNEKIEIPEKFQKFCREVATLAAKMQVNKAEIRIWPHRSDEWDGEVIANWSMGRHGDEAHRIVISSTVRVHTDLSGDPKGFHRYHPPVN